jgi:hypothetical protein
LGCKHSEKTKKLFSEQRRGAKNPNFGKSLSEKQKKSLSECGKKRTGKKNFFFGKKHTEETKQKISQANSIYVTTEIEEEIINLYKTCGALAISKKLGLGIKKINNILKKHNIVKRKSGPIKGNKHVRRPATEKTKNKLSIAFSGKNHPMWGIKGRDHPLYKTINKEIVKEAISMYLQGERYKDIQIKLQLSRNKLINILKENDIKLKRKGNYVRRTKKSGMGND